jgi:hypothetical protein
MINRTVIDCYFNTNTNIQFGSLTTTNGSKY